MKQILRALVILVLAGSAYSANATYIVECGYEGKDSVGGFDRMVVVVWNAFATSDGQPLNQLVGTYHLMSGKGKLVRGEYFTTDTNSISALELFGNDTVYNTYVVARDQRRLELKRQRDHIPTGKYDALLVYPDPTFAVLNVRLSLPGSNGWYDVSGYDPAGNRMFVQQFSTNGRDFLYALNVQNLPKGVYDIKLSDKTTVIGSQKIVLQ